MTNNCTCDPTNVTRTTLESHIGNTTVHVTSEDHTKINKIPGLESSLNNVSSRVSSLETNANTTINPEDYVTKTDLNKKDYITKTTLDLAIDSSITDNLQNYYTKTQTDNKISDAIANINVETTYPEIASSSSSSSRLVSINSFVTGTQAKPVINISLQDKDSIVLANDVVYVNIYATTDTMDKPSIDKKFTNPGSNWSESISDTGIYLWSSRGMKDVDGNYVAYADKTYWSDPQFCGAVNDTTSDTGVDTDIFNYIYWLTASETGSTAKPSFGVTDAKNAFDKGQTITDKAGTTVRTWNDHPTGVTSTLQYEYCSFAKYDDSTNEWGQYSVPFIFSHYGVDGRDGDGVEYIYKLSQTESVPAIQFDNTDPSYQEDDYIPDGWNDNPQSMYDPYLYQYCSVRKKTNGTWGNFSIPVLWSVYKKPADPVDTESILTLYKAGSKDAESTILTEDERKNSNRPDGWITTYPATGKDEYIYQIVAKTINGIVSLSDDSDEYYWSIPVRITSVDGTSGSDGGYVNYSFAISAQLSTSNVNTAPADINDSDWRDTPLQTTSAKPYLWTRIIKYDGLSNPTSVPTYTRLTGENANVDIQYSSDQIHWHDEFDSENDLYMRVSTDGKKTWSEAIRIVGEQGPTGATGADGADIDFVYCRTKTDDSPNTPTFTVDAINKQGNITVGDSKWTDNPQGVTSEYLYEWVSVNTKPSGSSTWAGYTKPVVWSKYGEKGVDGDTIEYVYKRTTTETTPDTPVAPINDNTLDDNFPVDWTDDPHGVDAEYLYEWVSVRKKSGENGIWGKYTLPVLWAKYGKDGKDGKDGTSAQGYSLDCDNPHVIVDDDTVEQFGVAADATYTLLDSTTESGQYKFEVSVDPSLTGVTCTNNNTTYSNATTTTLIYKATGDKLPMGSFVTEVTAKKRTSDGKESTVATHKQHITVKDFSLGEAYKLNLQTTTLQADSDGKLKVDTTVAVNYTKISNDGSMLLPCDYMKADTNGVAFYMYPKNDQTSTLAGPKFIKGTLLADYYTVVLILSTGSDVITVDIGTVSVTKDGKKGTDGSSVTVRYSKNGTEWHSTFQIDDIYMQTSTNGTTWSNTMRIVGERGEDGAWTDYSFGISANLTTTSPTVAPSDITSWFDGPISTTAAKPYLWMKSQKYSDATTEDGDAKYCRLTGEKGDDGTSVNIKGSVDYYKSSVSGYVPSNDETWAVDNGGNVNGTVIPGHCVVYYDGVNVQYTIPKAGDGYLVNSSFDEKGEYEGHLLVSDETKWIDAGKIQGPAGSDGTPGTSGKTTYVHFAYANSEDGTKDFTTDDNLSGERLYQGVYTDFIEADSTSPSKYTWHKQIGEDVIVLKATPDRLSFPANSNGIHINDSASNEVQLVLYIGGTPIPYTFYTLQYRTADDDTWTSDYKNLEGDVVITDSIEGSDDITVTVTVEIDGASWANDNAWTEYKAIYNGNEYVTRVDWIGSRAGKDVLPGTNGKNGAQIVYNISKFSECNVGKKFKDGTQEEVPCTLDVVIDDASNYYKCIKTYTLADKSTQGPTNTTYWERFETFTNVATDLVLAKKAYIKNLLLNYSTAVDSSNNITVVIDGETGKFTAKNAEITGAIQANTIGYNIQKLPNIDDYQTNISAPIYLLTKDSNELQTSCQVLTMDSSVIVLNSLTEYFDKLIPTYIDSTPQHISFVIPTAKKAGKICMEFFMDNPSKYINNQSDMPSLYIIQGGIQTGYENTVKKYEGIYVPISGKRNANVTFDVKSGNGFDNEIYDPTLIVNDICRRYFQSSYDFDLGLSNGYVELAKWEGTYPRYIKMMSDGEHWYLIDYKYNEYPN